MNRDRVATRGRRQAPPANGAGQDAQNRDRGGHSAPRGSNSAPKSGNWFARHKALSFTAVTVLALGLIVTGVVVTAMQNKLGILKATQPPTASAPSATDWSEVEVTETPGATAASSTDPVDPNYVWDKNVVNILVLGTDSSAERVKMGMNARTDCVMLVSINIEKKTAALISIPRDTYVKIYNSKNSVSAKNRINAAFTFGGGLKKNGIVYAMNTVNQFLSGGKIPIDHYVLFDMDLVRKLIDAVGTVDVDVQIDATIHGMVFKKGMMKLNGTQALAYARDRHNTAGGDFGRVGHQQQVMIALLKKLKDTGTVVSKIPELYNAFIGNLSTDMMDPMQILALAFVAKDMDLGNIHQYTIEGRGINVSGASMVAADQAKKQQVMQEVFGVTVPIDSSWTYDSLKNEIEKLLNEGKAIINTANNFLGENSGYYTADEADGLKSAISAWRTYSNKGDADNASDTLQDVQTQYEALKIIVGNRKEAIQVGKNKIAWAREKLNAYSGYISDSDRNTIESLINAVQSCVDTKDYNGVLAAAEALENTAAPIFSAVSPTEEPTAEPTTEPTAEPTAEPTVEPTPAG